MDMKLSEEQVHLRSTARKFVEKECTGEFIRAMEQSDLGYSRKMWQQMAEMGWLAMALPEAYGGLSLGLLDTVILAHELGRGICPGPFLQTAVIASQVILVAGSEQQRKRYLSDIASGETVIAFAFQEQTRHFGPQAIKLSAKAEGDHYLLSGSKMFVEFAQGADLLLVVARTATDGVNRSDGLTMFLVDTKSEGISYQHTPTMARDRQFEVSFDQVRVPKARRLGRENQAWAELEPIIERAAVVFSGYLVGVAEQMHEYATAFAKQRVQFGRPIGQMQLIQNYLASLIIEIYGAETLTLFTAYNIDKGRRVRGYVAKTKTFAGETVKRTTDIGSQIFGGIGYMEENHTTQYLRRGKQYQLMLGGIDYWESIIADEMFGDQGIGDVTQAHS